MRRAGAGRVARCHPEAHTHATHMYTEDLNKDVIKLRQKLLRRASIYCKVTEFVKKDAIRYFTYDYETPGSPDRAPELKLL
ncbi:hypothetical protein EVAR_64703_1 [Eumeta japonica]|uniref:Uncharacterized protein n=1 Tax=Eumeta variegata TaxID=151549 RepID=A0A4C1ZQX7_EUMVA|nr:hypothetical protein EVAR_64703_1 [Eumeta japonica]